MLLGAGSCSSSGLKGVYGMFGFRAGVTGTYCGAPPCTALAVAPSTVALSEELFESDDIDRGKELRIYRIACDHGSVQQMHPTRENKSPILQGTIIDAAAQKYCL